ncbi:MAG: DUF6065 family protein [Planctomycetota bacterium]
MSSFKQLYYRLLTRMKNEPRPKSPKELRLEKNGFYLKVYRLHPEGIRLEKAHMNLKGDAHPIAMKYCGPFNHANGAGWWVYPPFDLDVTYLGEGKWDYQIVKEYEPLEKEVLAELLRPGDPYSTTERSRYAFGLSEPETLQIWTGCILKTAPGWCIYVRSPVNLGMGRPYSIQEGVIESDWMPYDIWLNVKFHRKGEKVEIRRAMWPPLAVFLPIRRESYDPSYSWGYQENLLNRGDPESAKLYEGWQAYNFEKWKAQGEKDPLTYYRNRKETLKKMRDEKQI